MRPVVPILPVLLGLATSATPQDATRPAPVFPGQVESVFIDVSVADGKNPIAGLGAADFLLTDDGVPCAFELMPMESVPVRTVLLFDTSHSMAGDRIEKLRRAADNLLSQLASEDEATLISFSNEIRWTGTLKRDLAPAKIGVLRLEAGGGTSLYDALLTAMLVPRAVSRPLIVVFSDGGDNASIMTASRVRKMAERSNVLIHVVAVATPPNRAALGGFFGPRSITPEAAYLRALSGIAESTGGSLLEIASADQISQAFAAILHAVRQRYVLRYEPAGTPRPGWHRLEVKLRSKRGTVRGRSGYWASPGPAQ